MVNRRKLANRRGVSAGGGPGRLHRLVALALCWAAAGCVLAAPIDPAGLFHDYGRFYLRPSEPGPGEAVTLRFQTKHLDADSVSLQVKTEGVAGVQTLPMTKESEGILDTWTASLVVGTARIDYWFQVQKGADILYYNAFQASTQVPANLNFWLVPGFHVPDWSKGITWYQIFPERFFDGDPAGNVTTGEYDYFGPVQAKSWGASPSGSNDFFGGDLPGVQAKLGPYLQGGLGIEAIYFNPVFRSPSNHKYDTMDYRNVDPHFGGNDAFTNLAGALHADADFPGDYPVRFILDGVFNHCGDWHYWFDRAHQWPGSEGAYESQASPYAPYFTFNTWPNDYVTFGVSFGGHFDTMPKLDYADAGLVNEIYGAPGSIARTWLGAHWAADGWRLDVGQEVGYGGTVIGNHTVWAEFRQAVRSVNPEALILGELWDLPLAYLQGDEWDSAMNYNGFLTPVGRWLLKADMFGNHAPIDTPLFHAWMQGTLADNTGCVRLAMMNSNGAHDNPRLFTRAGGNPGLVKAAQAFLLTYPGAPCVYYGDEIGLPGGADPDNRRTFPWDTLADPPSTDLLDFHATLIGLRREKTALRTGSYRDLLADEASGTFAFARFDGKDTVVTVVRRKGTVAAPVALPVWVLGVPDGSVFADVFTSQAYSVAGGTLALTLPGEGFGVLVLEKARGAATRFAVGPERQCVLKLSSPDGALRAGWARLTPDDPAAVGDLAAAESFRYNPGSADTTETVLYPAAPLTRFRLLATYAKNVVDSGVALTNPGAQAAHVTLRLVTQAGNVYTAVLTLDPLTAHPRYLSALFPTLPDVVDGVVDVTSDQPVAPLQLTVRTNARGEFLLSALPVVPLTDPAPGSDLILNYLAAGGGYTTEIRLTTTGAVPVEGDVRFYDPSGAPLELEVGKR
ncbi:MAG: glycoside hydrolase family 13 protein [Acidobacteria bacterium]|nr:glycoside hydrolase family 13 protein [Acidobacteriota bacterium]